MREKWRRLLVEVKLVPVLTRKDVFEADIYWYWSFREWLCKRDRGETVTSMETPFFISYISIKYDFPWYIQIRQNFNTQFWDIDMHI